MDMSLDDIIKIRKITLPSSKKYGDKKPIKQGLRKTLNKPVFKENQRITNGRFQVIHNNRAKFRDARDKLPKIRRNNGDLRMKLMQKQDTNKFTKMGGNDDISSRLPGFRRTVSVATSGSLRTKSSNYNTSSLPTSSSRRRENNFKISREKYAAASRIICTIENDLAWGSSSRQERRMLPDLRSIYVRLESAPDSHASMGGSSMPNSSPGYRIVVSNLHTSITQSDIKELFEDIGDLFDSRIVRPGVAEVIYKSLSDAEKAVDAYHNRRLDGQPMECLLVNPRASNKPTASPIPSSK